MILPSQDEALPFSERLELTPDEKKIIAEAAGLDPDESPGLRLANAVCEAGRFYYSSRQREQGTTAAPSVIARRLQRLAGAVRRGRRTTRSVSLLMVERLVGWGDLSKLGSVSRREWPLLSREEMATELKELASMIQEMFAPRYDDALSGTVLALGQSWLRYAKQAVRLPRSYDEPDGKTDRDDAFRRFVETALRIIDPELASGRTFVSVVRRLVENNRKFSIGDIDGFHLTNQDVRRKAGRPKNKDLTISSVKEAGPNSEGIDGARRSV